MTCKNLTITFELGRMSTCRLPRFSAFVMFLRRSGARAISTAARSWRQRPRRGDAPLAACEPPSSTFPGGREPAEREQRAVGQRLEGRGRGAPNLGGVLRRGQGDGPERIVEHGHTHNGRLELRRRLPSATERRGKRELVPAFRSGPAVAK